MTKRIVNVYFMTFSQGRNLKLSFILFTSKSYFKCYCVFAYLCHSGQIMIWLFSYFCLLHSAGEYIQNLCTKQQQTVCQPCNKGYFSSQYSTFARCDDCLVCQQSKTERCSYLLMSEKQHFEEIIHEDVCM